VPKTGSSTIDPLDQVFLTCLQMNGRASWHTIAGISRVSETTVARRVQQMMDDGVLRITGVLDVFRSGLGTPVLVRIGCVPGSVDSVCETIAARSDARFVTSVTGKADCVAEFVVSSRAELRQLLGRDLPGVDGVRSSESLVVLRTFRAAHDWDPGLLDADAVQQLRPQGILPFERGDRDDTPVEMDETDLAIATALAKDGRMPYREMAAEIGVSETTVARRVESLVTLGCLHFRTLIAPALLGFDMELMLWLTVDPAHLDQVGRRLAEEHTVKYLVATAGSYHLTGRVALRRHEDLYALLTDTIGALNGVRDVDITIELRTFKRSWVIGEESIELTQDDRALAPTGDQFTTPSSERQLESNPRW
jgi:DNA-binding Lrp family transcriptional regulator